MATVAIQNDWKDITADQSLTVGTEYGLQAISGDLEYVVNTSATAPGDKVRGFVLFYGSDVGTYTPKQNEHFWVRKFYRVRGGEDTETRHLQIAAG